MNYLPFCGYWFYGGTTDTETANYYGSYGLCGSISSVTSNTVAWLKQFGNNILRKFHSYKWWPRGY